MRALAAERGRTVKFGIRLHVIVRETEQEAWAAANDLIKYVDDDLIALTKLYQDMIQLAKKECLNSIMEVRKI